MKKRTLAEAKHLLNLWVKVLKEFELRAAQYPTALNFICVRALYALETDEESEYISQDLYGQSREFFSPKFRALVRTKRPDGGFYTKGEGLFENSKARRVFIHRRINRLQAEILKLQRNGAQK